MTMVKLHSPVQKNINTFFDEFFNELPAFGKTVNNIFSPAVNILETTDAYHLELNAPGRNKEDFNISIDKGLLTISYEKKEEDDLTPGSNKNISLEEWKKTWMAKSKYPTVFISALSKENFPEMKKMIYDEVHKIHISRFPYCVVKSTDFFFRRHIW